MSRRLMGGRDTSWMDDGACVGLDPTLFHPLDTGGKSDAAREAREAPKRICRACPVVDQCQEYGIATRQEYGIWGALDPRDRRAVIRSRQRAAQAAREAQAS